MDDEYAVSFRVDTDGLPEADILTLEIDGLAFPFEDRSDGGTDFWEWDVPEDLSNSDLPIGDRVVVCLRTAAQVCPTSVPSALSVADVSAEEGEDLIFTVELSPPSTETVTVDWATSGGTAASGTDFTAGTGTLTFTAGVTEQTFTVATIEDVTDQKNETFTVTLSNATNATISGATATGTIKDDDAPPLVAWSTVMTVAEVFSDPSHGYSENNGGELADADFQYDSATYTVEGIYVTSFVGVSFRVDEEGLPQDEILTLVIDGHELPFSESDAYGNEWEWDVPEGLNDLVNDLPVGNSVVVCLRNGTGVCPARALTVTDVSAEEGRGPDLHGDAVAGEHGDGDGGLGDLGGHGHLGHGLHGGYGDADLHGGRHGADGHGGDDRGHDGRGPRDLHGDAVEPDQRDDYGRAGDRNNRGRRRDRPRCGPRP